MRYGYEDGETGYRMLIIIFGGEFRQGNSPKRLGKDAKGNKIVHPPVSLDEHVAVQRENKVRTFGNEEFKKMRRPCSSISFTRIFVTEEEGLHKGYDRFQKILIQLNQVQARPDNDDINLKFLRALPSSWLGRCMAVPPSLTVTYMPIPIKSDIEKHNQDQRLPPSVDIKTLPEFDVEDIQIPLAGSPSFFFLADPAPAASRNRPAVNSAGRPNPTGRVGQAAHLAAAQSNLAVGPKRPYLFSAGRPGDPSKIRTLGQGSIVKFGSVAKVEYQAKGTIRTQSMTLENATMLKLQHINLYTLYTQIYDKKNKVSPSQTPDCLVLTEEFQLPDESQVVLRIPRERDLYTFSISELQPEQNVTCLVAKASLDESTRWHRRMAHVNYKTINKLAKEGLVAGLPLKVFTNEHNCVACNKGKQHKASYKHISAVRLITETLQLLHMDLFGPTNIRSIDQKYYSLVVTDDFSRFTWTFFLGTKDETFYVLKEFIALIENQLNKKVKGIRCDNGTEFKNAKLIELCGEKGIKRDYSNPRTPQQNRVAERKNRTLIEAARTMCQLRIPHNKTPYELISGKVPQIGHLKPFGCQVTILNTSDHLGKFEGKADEDYAEELAKLQRQEYEAKDAAGTIWLFVLTRNSRNTKSNLSRKFEPRCFLLKWILLSLILLVVYLLVVNFSACSDPAGGNPPAPAVEVNPVPTKRVNIIHPHSQILGDLASPVLTRSRAQKSKLGHRQEEGIDYDEMDVKSAFSMEKLEEEVVVKALYGLHQAPRAWYARLSAFLLQHNYRRGTIDKTLFIKKDSRDILLVQIHDWFTFVSHTASDLTKCLQLVACSRPSNPTVTVISWVLMVIESTTGGLSNFGQEVNFMAARSRPLWLTSSKQNRVCCCLLAAVDSTLDSEPSILLASFYILPADRQFLFLLVDYDSAWQIHLWASINSDRGDVFRLFAWFLLLVDTFCWLNTFMLLELFMLSIHLFMLLNWVVLFDIAGWLILVHLSHLVSAGSLQSCWCNNVSAE
ncbi:putative ribonuclease H-like domain-containing protein [Tanacetum coccineum]